MMIFRRLIKPNHLNSANILFGGTLMAWIDEAAAMYAMCQMNTKNVVTLKISEVLFKKPARQGDVLEFTCHPIRYGSSSFTLKCIVATKQIGDESQVEQIAECEMVFVSIDPVTGSSIPYRRNE